MTYAPGERIPAEKRVTCKRCGARDLAWAKSSKTGRWYLTNTAPSGNTDAALRGARWFAPWSPHKCRA